MTFPNQPRITIFVHSYFEKAQKMNTSWVDKLVFGKIVCFSMVQAASSLLKENKKLHTEDALSVSCGTTLQTKLDLMASKGPK